ncbi:MAG TPA: hypothetical protein VMJ92_02920, partial [Candidatus Limnocylindrales bacterium]|nr:hypothetical protein [Candidatus Limnocylindrales bacterium]
MPEPDLESFTGLSEAVRTLRARGDGARAIELLEAHVDGFPLHKGLVFLTLAEALADAGRRDDAIDALRRALEAGCRYRRDWLVNDPHF